MKQSSLLSFFGNVQRRKREEMEKEQAQNDNKIAESTQISLSTQKSNKEVKEISTCDDTEVANSSVQGTRKSNLKRPKLAIDSDEDDVFNPEDLKQFSHTSPQKNSQKKGIRFQKNDMIDEDNDDESFKEDDIEDIEDEEDDDDFIEDSDEEVKPKRKQKQSQQKTPVKKTGSASKAGATKSTPKFGQESAKKSATKQSTAKKAEDEFINCDQENDLARAAVDQLDDTTPYFALPENAMDSKKRKRTDPNYDPTTLYVPPESLKQFTPVMRQYWEIKSTNFDKILFFKLGKFYELFYEDALITHKELDLNWMGKKMHTGFPEKALDKMASKLISLGYKVAVAEQTETPEQMKQRLMREKSGPKCVSRELVQVMTKGTYDQNNETDYQPRYLMSLRNFQTKFGIIIVESSTNVITVAYLNDDIHFTQFKTLLCQVKPQEIVYDPDNMTHDIKKIIQSGYLAPQLSPLQNKNDNWNKGMAYNHLDKTHGDVLEGKWPKLLNNLYNTEETKRDLIFESMAGLFNYLKSILILDQVISVARYQIYDIEKGVRSCMILDSQSLQHLEILDSSSGPVSTQKENYKLHFDDGSLLGYINKTKTPFGYRMLKNWICAPLMDINKIYDRYDAIEDLQKFNSERDTFLRGIEKLPDLEKMCGRIYKYSIRQQNQNVVYFEDFSYSRLKEFKDLTTKLAESEKLIKTHLTPFADQFKSKRLRKLVTPNTIDHEDEEEYELPAMIYHGYSDEEDEVEENINQHAAKAEKMEIENKQSKKSKSSGLLPPASKYIQEFQNYIVWQGPKGQEKPLPKKGLVNSYDLATEAVQNVEKKLQNYLVQIQQQMKDKTIKYGLRYELEINEDLVKGNKKPKNFDFTSKAGKYQRFQTKELRELIAELDEAEDVQKKELKEFCRFIFKEFYESYKTWDTLINILAELDCLISLSRVSFLLADGVMSRPELYPASEKYVPFIELTSGRHPCLASMGVNFIPNDIYLGDIKQTGQFEDNKNLILLTGPNMGGKSTTLRMACVMAILAQIGCYVPAKSLRMTLVDRIFTRIGASDKLMDGKSTFFIEMEETSNAVKQGSKHSLIIMDELGRGTSTFDGVAIAYSIVRYLVENLQSRCLFATHYHVLLDEFRHYPQIAYYHMACHVDEKRSKVIFLYRLKAGECSSSFGINVAKVVGISDNLIEIAKQKAKEFEENLNIQHAYNTNKRFGILMKAIQEYDRDENLEQIIEQFNKVQLL
ncbi:MutS domain III protein (macronuclear) [Tetrahymena thermophila SB210]|uniref:DNA mismatch repair protein n=2 Tax=Tetrahymena thermophila TaxID=5911 RepID=Q23K54_TETTS|nr:MutS domain III protein [Tetrahymena thermophila SB210]ADQ26782.1 putative mismatch repair protein [Tetrahymena thermophila]EAR96989.1 MutS domain III protein [Tetrahymena thermophila SB210]|eukprot:XP_001017234.1 MutS domain III protein [Tetrahymena thermophila SB210]